MAIGRTEFHFAVVGADQAAAAHDRVAASENRAAAASTTAAAASRASEAAMHANTAAALKGDSALASFGKAASKAVEPLRFWANILPGLGIAGMILGIYEATTATLGWAASMVTAGSAADRLAKSTGTLSAEAVQQALKVNSIADAMDRYAKSIGVASAKQLTFRQEQAALRAVASGEVLAVEKVRADVERLDTELSRAKERLAYIRSSPEQFAAEATSAGGYRALEAAAQRRIDDIKRQADELDRANARLVGQDARTSFQRGVSDLWQGIATRTKIAGQSAVDAARQAAANYTAVIEAEFEIARRKEGKTARRSGGAATREQSLAEVVGGIAAQSNPRAAMQAGALGTIDAEIARQEAARMAELERFATINDQRNAMALAHMQSIEAEAPKMADAFKMVGDSFDGMTGRMVSSATDAAGIVTQAIGAITGALGGMVTNMIIAGDAGAKGMAKQAGNVLASLSAQAFGYSILLEGMALAAVFIPGLQLSAPGLAKAGAVMAGIGAALGISARALGAEKLGGGGGGRSAAGGGGAGGGGGNPAAGTNPAAGQSERPVYVSVQIGDEPVMGIVRRANEREARRGGMSGHFAMAGG